ncbi:MAG: PQQ-binding-like beta-propeller repeat protein [Bacteroidaceae bacterium]|nr:PQQ-binding-like beta-propeller repeat protein [Bacteroidaceae bacterium]MBQ9883062.1 PQQ-binding-like beta-propeller repeat protein [Bacteroidaceae bacterium]
MKRWFIYGLVLLLCSCTGNGDVGYNTVTDWPFYRADASMSGYTSLSLPEKPTLLWTFKDGVRTVSSPIVYEGVTYWVNRRGHVFGVNLTGEKVFDYDMKTSVEATPIIHDGVLYIGRIDGILEAIDLQRADTLWTFETLGQISATPNLVDFQGQKAVVFGSYDNYMYVVDQVSGKELNHFESGYYINGAVAIWQNHVLFGGCDAWLRLIDCQSGAQTDSLEVQAYIPASPAIKGGYAYVADYAGDVYELQLKNGKINAHKMLVEATSADGSLTSVPAVSDDAVFVLPDGRHIVAISRESGKELWKYMLKGNTGDSSPLVCDDKVIVCTSTGIVSILDAKDGTLKWEYDTGEQILGSPAVIKDHFFILTTKGTLLCFGES